MSKLDLGAICKIIFADARYIRTKDGTAKQPLELFNQRTGMLLEIVKPDDGPQSALAWFPKYNVYACVDSMNVIVINKPTQQQR